MSLLNPVEETPFYKSTWFLIIVLFLFAPAGLALLWMSDEWARKTKIIVTVVVAFLAAAWLFQRML